MTNLVANKVVGALDLTLMATQISLQVVNVSRPCDGDVGQGQCRQD